MNLLPRYGYVSHRERGKDVLFDEGTVATIYNWKNGKSYCGADGLNVEDIREWNVGGNSQQAVTRVKNVLNAR